MRVLFTILFFFGGFFGFAEEAEDPFAVTESQLDAVDHSNSPATLAEAHAQLEEQLPEDTLKQIDEMTSEDEMIMLHFGPGIGMRNDWGLWGDSPLAKHMKQLGFTHADDMSSVILETFWCKRHGKDFKIEERVAYYKAYWKENKWPDKTVVDPSDQSKVRWSRKVEAEGHLHRMIYIGRSEDTGRLLAFENSVGVYVPDSKLLESLEGAANTTRSREGEMEEPQPEQ